MELIDRQATIKAMEESARLPWYVLKGCFPTLEVLEKMPAVEKEESDSEDSE